MNKILSKNECTGCMACQQICSMGCIDLSQDELGNVYPEINQTKCINCNKCRNVCPIINIKKLSFSSINKAYASWSLDDNIRKSSASGGIGAQFYKTALEDDYWIGGVSFENDFHVVHSLSRNVNSINKYQKSKYLFSETLYIFKNIKLRLENNEKVLFISLPCKIAGLKTFLKKDYHNLLTVDIVCHGTPPYQYLKEHLDNIECMSNDNFISFREDNDFIFKVNSKEKILYSKVGYADTYLAAFLSGLDYRPSCYNCPFARSERISDITICDFWGLGKEKPFDHPYTGAISAVLINTEKGEKFFSKCTENIFYEERPVDEAINGNDQLQRPTRKHPKRNLFEESYLQNGFDKAVITCLKKEIRNGQKEQLKRIMKNEIKKFLMNAMG